MLKRPIIAPFLAIATITISGCFYPYSTPPTGASELSWVPHYTQEKLWYCAPAVIRMWLASILGHGPSTTQDQIWAFAQSNYPGHTSATWPGGGMSLTALAATATHFTGWSISIDQYNFEDGIRQAVADQKKSISLGYASAAVVNNNTHLVLVRGTSWNKLSDALQRPQSETMKIHDPAPSGGGVLTVSLGQWMNYSIRTVGVLGCNPCALNAQRSSVYGTGASALTTFDDNGGVYQGPAPAAPTGRYRLDGNGACYWDNSESGSNACTTASGGPYMVSLEASNGQFVVAEGNGGGAVNADRNAVGAWETFSLVDLNGGLLMDGDEVTFQTGGGWFLQADGCGGGAFLAIGGAPYAWETFRVRTQGGDARVDSGDHVALETSCGYYVVAENGGGNVVNADRTGVGLWETFRIWF